jgi:hypothetical protein
MAHSDRKKPTSKSDDDATTSVENMSLKDPEDKLSDPKEEEDDMKGEDETVPMRGMQRVPRKNIPARSTREEDRVICITWYETFLNLKTDAAEYLYDLEELTKPSNWVN